MPNIPPPRKIKLAFVDTEESWHMILNRRLRKRPNISIGDKEVPVDLASFPSIEHFLVDTSEMDKCDLILCGDLTAKSRRDLMTLLAERRMLKKLVFVANKDFFESPSASKALRKDALRTMFFPPARKPDVPTSYVPKLGDDIELLFTQLSSLLGRG